MTTTPSDIRATVDAIFDDVEATESIADRFAKALMAEREATIELAIKRAIAAWPRAHTYASENADLYRSQDLVRDRIVQNLEAYLTFIRSKAPPDTAIEGRTE